MIKLPFSFFETGLSNGMNKLPNEKIRDLQQAAISAGFDVTSARYCVEEQNDFGSKDYHNIDVWIDGVVGMTSRGTSNGDDFRQLLFESINHEVRKGLYYKFDNSTWITYFTDMRANIAKDIGVRRCNNVMRIIDPENGSIFCVPCVVDYDMTAPSMQVASSVLTPNSHAIVLVQGNSDTNRLFKINTRYILGGRPFKLLAYQNTIIDKNIADHPTLLTLDLFLDELHAEDDIENQLADNGQYEYALSIDSNDMEVAVTSAGQFKSSVSLNGQEVNRQVIWESLNQTVAKVDENGNYQIIGKAGQTATIVARLSGNDNVYDAINLKIVDEERFVPKIIVEPSFAKLRQFETVNFEVQVNLGNEVLNPDDAVIEFSIPDAVELRMADGRYRLQAKKITKNLIMHIQAQMDSPVIAVDEDFEFEITSMMG